MYVNCNNHKEKAVDPNATNIQLHKRLKGLKASSPSNVLSNLFWDFPVFWLIGQLVPTCVTIRSATNPCVCSGSAAKRASFARCQHFTWSREVHQFGRTSPVNHQISRDVESLKWNIDQRHCPCYSEQTKGKTRLYITSTITSHVNVVSILEGAGM